MSDGEHCWVPVTCRNFGTHATRAFCYLVGHSIGFSTKREVQGLLAIDVSTLEFTLKRGPPCSALVWQGGCRFEFLNSLPQDVKNVERGCRKTSYWLARHGLLDFNMFGIRPNKISDVRRVNRTMLG